MLIKIREELEKIMKEVPINWFPLSLKSGISPITFKRVINAQNDEKIRLRTIRKLRTFIDDYNSNGWES